MTQSHKRKGGASLAGTAAPDSRFGADQDAAWLNPAAINLRGAPPRAGITGTEGDDVIQGTSGNDLIQGLGGDDFLFGNDGDDRLEGGDDDDDLNAGAGNDMLYGGAGNDSLGDLSDTPGNEQFYGEDGNDTLYIEWNSGTAANIVLLDGGIGNDFLDFYAPDHLLDQVTLIGGDGNDIISAYGGLDVTVDAGAGADRIILVAGATDFTVTLGADADRLRIATLGSGSVEVMDFAAGDSGDQLELLVLLDNYLTNWDAATNPFATGHIRLVQSGADTLVQIDRDAGDAVYDFVNLVTLQNVTASALTAFNLDYFPPNGSVPAGRTIIGTEFNNVLNGNFGDDIIQGLAGDDRIRGRAGNDQIDGGDDDDMLDGDEGDDVIHGGNGFDLLIGDAGDDLLYGDADDDVIEDRVSGDDQLFGGAGFDQMTVERGDIGPGDTILMDAGADGASMRFQSDRYVDAVTIAGGDGEDEITVFGGGTVTIDAGAGDDLISVSNIGGAISLTLGAGTDSLLPSIVILNGGLITINDFAGGDTGDRIFVQSLGVYQLIQRGGDTVLQVDQNGSEPDGFVDYALIKNTLAADFVLSSEQYLWTPGDLDDDPPVAVDDTILGFEGELYSGGGLLVNDFDADGPAVSIAMVNGSAANLGQIITLASGAELRVEADGDWSYNALGATFVPIPSFFSGASNLYFLDSFTYTLAGGGTATVTVQVQGADTNDTLFGTAGADVLAGGTGSDSYRVENAADLVIESVGEGQDGVYVAMNLGAYALAAGSEVEILSAIDPGSTAAMNLTGNEFANLIIGTAGSNTLIGGGAADILIGGAGNDFYRVEEAGDAVVEGVGGGFDSVYAVTSYTLAAGSQVELLSAIDPASTAAMNLTGNEFANLIYGNAAGNTLIGGGGADTLFGGAGNDFYRVEEAGDTVVEGAGGGFDSVYAVTSYTLTAGSEVELLSAINPASTAGMNLTGNEYANLIYGNAGVNTLIGGGGADTLIGGGGNDFYRVEDAGDTVVEAAGGGADSVYAVISYTLAAGSEVELLSAIDPGSTAAMNLTGNEYANAIYGTAGSNTLIGGGGADTLVGGGGNDFYRVEEAGDTVVEGAGGGFDSIYAVVSYTLAAGSEVELLSAIDPASAGAMDLTGNEFANRLYGNAGFNILDGKGGSDLLTGGAGVDFFAFTTMLGAANVDAIADFVSGTDMIRLENAVFTALAPGVLNPNAFVIGSAAADASDRIVYDQTTGQLFYDADGSGAGAAILFATLQGAPVLTASDFQII